mgnify:CR=1 FL=1
MARLESKSVTCSPESENSTIDLYQEFGWVLQSSQEVFNKDSHLEDRSGTTYSVTQTTNYVKLIFSRDKDMPYYEQIAQLERDYFSVKEVYPSKAGKVITMILGLVFTAIGALATWGNGGEGFGPIFILIIGIGLLVLSIVLAMRYRTVWDNAEITAATKRTSILEEVRKYV